MTRRDLLHILLALGAGFLVAEFANATQPVKIGLGLFTCIAWLWISEAVHISVTALVVPLIASLTGIFSLKEALVNFANPVIFLFMGGFALAAALQKYQLDRMFAVRMLALSRGIPLLAILLMFLTTAFLSMWISNTAAVAMMLPLALGLLARRDPLKDSKLFLFVLLGLAYSGNLGGMATLIGSPPNAIAAAAVGIDFSGWLAFGVPAFLLLFPLMVIVLYLYLRPTFGSSLQLDSPSELVDHKRSWVLVIFLLTAVSWVMSDFLAGIVGVPAGFDSIIALAAIILLLSSGCLSFSEFTGKTNWGILILFGGGLTLSAALQASGASGWLAEHIVLFLPDNNRFLALLIVCAFVIFLTELVSNTASAALLIPLFISVAGDLGFQPEELTVIIALCASCAFMLPVATPPNALVFSSGFVPQQQMMRIGLLLNIIFAIVLSVIFWVSST